MARFFPPTLNSNSNFLSKKHQCLALLQSCSSMPQLLQIHAQIFTLGRCHDKFLLSELLRFCSLSPSGNLSYARTLLRSSPDPMRSSWNHLIRGYSHSDTPAEALHLFVDMRRHGLRPNELTVPFVLKSCTHLSDLRTGRQVHADAVKNAVEAIVYVHNSLINLYQSCLELQDAVKVFEEMTVRTVVSWNTILNAYVENSLPEECVGVFHRMRICGFEPDQATLVVLLSVSAELGSLRLGKLVHNVIIRKGLDVNVQLGTAFVNMYAKCGVVGSASHLFERMPYRNVWTWSAIIMSYAQHGLAEKAFELFAEMKSALIKPNYVTFLGILCACSHSGLIEDGYRFFDEMVRVHAIEPMMTHYSAMVDVLGRKGRLEEALEFIRRMPVEADAVVWRTLLSACHVHNANGSTGVGEIARKKLLMLEPRRSGNYVMASNMYLEEGLGEKAAKTRRMMREEGLKKAAGESCIEVHGLVYHFISGDDSSVDWYNIYVLLYGLNLNMRKVGSRDLDISND